MKKIMSNILRAGAEDWIFSTKEIILILRLLLIVLKVLQGLTQVLITTFQGALMKENYRDILERETSTCHSINHSTVTPTLNRHNPKLSPLILRFH